MASVTCPDWTASARIAVLAVLAYHIGLSWAPGGLLGVGVFFTLSGYIITDLLLGQQARTGSLQLVDFWLRRARRLLPALFVMLTVVVGWVALFDRAQLAALRGMVASAALYVSNWWLIAQHHRTSRGSGRRRRSATCGPWPWRSSSTWSGPGWCCSAWR